LVSVLIPTYDRPHYLKSAIESVLAQTLTDFEVIVRNDCGPADTASVVADFSDSRLAHRRNERNLGLAGNNSILFAEATGRYVAHLDDDDAWTPTYLESLVAPMEADDGIDLAFSDHTVIDENGRQLTELTLRGRRRWGRVSLQHGVQDNGRWIAAVTRSVPAGHSAVLRRTAIAGGFDPRVGQASDMWVACAGARRTGRIWFDPRPLSLYRVHPGQITGALRPHQDTDEKFRGLVWCWEQLIADPAYRAEATTLRRLVSNERAKWSLAAIQDGQKGRALSISESAVATIPTAFGWTVRAAAITNAAIPGRLGQRAVRMAARLRSPVWIATEWVRRRRRLRPDGLRA
jgi:hypothetical protein